MKKFLSLFAIASLFVAGFTSCDEEDATYTPEVSNIKITATDVLFDPQASTGKIVYESNAKVTFSTEANWITLSQSEANAINVEVKENTELIGRSGVVVLSDGSGKINVIVQQKGLAFGFYDGEFTEIPAAGETYSIEGKASFDVTFKDCPDWIHFNKTATGYDIVVDETTTSNDRSATVTLDGNGMTATFEFAQLGSFNFKSADYNISNLGDSSIILKGVVTEDLTVEITGGENWLEIDTLKNGYKMLIPANPDPATRTAKIKISCTDYSAEYNVSQVGVYMNILDKDGENMESLYFSNAAASAAWTVNANATFTLTCEDWFTATIENDQIKVDVQENKTGAARAGWLKYSLGTIFEDSIAVLQYDPAKDLRGTGIMLYYDSEDNKYYYYNINITETGIEFPDFLKYAGDGVVWNVPMKRDAEKGQVSISNGDYVGKFSTSYDLYNMVATDEGKLTLSEQLSIAEPYYDLDEENLVAVFSNDFAFVAFTPDAGFVGSAYKGTLIEINKPVIILVSEEEDTEGAALKRVPSATRLTAPRKSMFSLK